MIVFFDGNAQNKSGGKETNYRKVHQKSLYQSQTQQDTINTTSYICLRLSVQNYDIV